MNQVSIKSNLNIGDLVEVLYQYDNTTYGIVLGFKQWKDTKLQDEMNNVMVKILFDYGVRMQPMIWCKLVQKLIA